MSLPAPAKTRTADLPPILADAVYSIEQFQRATGIKRWGLRQCRKAGLKICRVSGRGFIIGRHWIEWLEQQAGGVE